MKLWVLIIIFSLSKYTYINDKTLFLLITALDFNSDYDKPKDVKVYIVNAAVIF